MLTLYIVYSWFLGICYGFVLISSAAGQNDVHLFQVGEVSIYQFHSTVLLNENIPNAKNVGFFITGEVLLHSIWTHEHDTILKLELRTPQLHIRSRKAPTPDGFIQHSSKLESFSLKPLYFHWHRGKILKLLSPKGEVPALSNLKKGLASLFQFQILDVETNETDSSGHCKTIYQTVDAIKFEKTKVDCISPDFPHIQSNDPILKTIITSSRRVTYELNQQSTVIKKIYARENHQMVVAVKEDLGSMVEADQTLNHLRNEKTDTIKAATLDEAFNLLPNGYIEDTLLIQKEELNDDRKSLPNLVNDLRDNILTKHLGSLVSSKAFLRLVEVAKKAKPEEISKVLAAKKNQQIILQIYDILGYVQTPEAHASVMKKLHFDRDDHLDASERYLWSLSLSEHPHPEIIKDLLNRYRKNDHFPDKVKETLILTIAAMASKTSDRKIVRNVEETIINNFNYAKGENRFVFLRALKNFRSSSVIDLLLKTIKEGTNKEGVLAFKALKAIDPSSWNLHILKASRRTFLQLDRKYDSSARTLAVDILLESQPTDDTLKDLLYYLKLNETNFEVKQYVLQYLQMMSDEDKNFSSRLSLLIKSDPSLNNYDTLAPKGLSTALKRPFIKSPTTNGSLVTIQEMFSGVVKRGIVDVVMEKNELAKQLFRLGIFAGGLSSFTGGDVEGDEESATAGMELTILGTQIRPFVFFNGQGELMGHVWSGTASERTTAFQSLILLQDHQEFIRLGPGFIAEFNLKGGVSFDLAGNIEISIWSRTADSVVEKSAGIVTNGLIVVDSSFVRSQIEFSASIEPKLHLKSNIDFSGSPMACMRVTQPDTIFRHNIFKIERIPGSKHKMRIAKYKKMQVPGTTYSLNRKNNELCSAMFS